MRFADVDGTMIDVYQVPTHLVNESGMQFPTAIHTQLERAVGPEGYYGILGTHCDYTDNFDQQLVQAALAYDIPAVSAQQVLDCSIDFQSQIMAAKHKNLLVIGLSTFTKVKGRSHNDIVTGGQNLVMNFRVHLP